MTVKQLIEKLKELPGDYEVIYESGDGYGNAYCAYIDEITINHNAKEIKLCE